jgi:hypothetical protein
MPRGRALDTGGVAGAEWSACTGIVLHDLGN